MAIGDGSRLDIKTKRLLKEGGPTAVINAMTELQRKFVEEYMKDFNAPQALKRAGSTVSSDGSSRKIVGDLLRNPLVKVAIEWHTTKRAEKLAVDHVHIQQKWLKLIDAVEPEALKGDKGAAATFLRASELLAKSIGMFIERTEVTGQGGSAIQIEEINDAAATFARSIAGLATRSRTGSQDESFDAGNESRTGVELGLLGATGSD